MTRAEQFYNFWLLKYYSETNCGDFQDSDPTVFAGAQYGSTIAIWVIVFLCTFKSIRVSSYVKWPLVIIPTLFLIILMIGILPTSGASNGVA